MEVITVWVKKQSFFTVRFAGGELVADGRGNSGRG